MAGKKRLLTPQPEDNAKKGPGAKHGNANDGKLEASCSADNGAAGPPSAAELASSLSMEVELDGCEDMSSSSDTELLGPHPDNESESQQGCTPTLKLQSSDGTVFEVDVAAVKVSQTMKDMLDNLGAGKYEIMPLPNLESDVLEKVIAWAEHHKDDRAPSEDNSKEIKKYGHYITPWEEEFLHVSPQMLFKLIEASIYLDIRGLQGAACEVVAKKISGKTPEEIRFMFDIKNDFTLEQQAVNREENAWVDM